MSHGVLPEGSPAAEAARYNVKVWELKRSANYGSPRVNEHALPVTRAEVLADLEAIAPGMPTMASIPGRRAVRSGRAG